MPAPGTFDRWLRIEKDNTVTLLTGKVEIGQGVLTALAQCVADELDVAFDHVRVPAPDTAVSPDEGYTAGSRSMEETGTLMRRVAAELRALLLDRAAQRLGLSAASLTVTDGVVAAPGGKTVRYADLVDGAMLAREATGLVEPKAPAARRVIGTRVKRRDLANKVSGAPAYIQDLVLDGMVHARVVRPPSPAARLLEANEGELRKQPGVIAVVRDGSFLAVVADTEIAAIRAQRAARRLSTWEETASLPSTVDPRYLLDEKSEEYVALETNDGPKGKRTFAAEFSKPFTAHGALGPSCALAKLEDGKYTVWSHTQGIHPVGAEIAKVLGVARGDVRVIHAEGAGCYGHNGSDDVALDAALIARGLPGRAVRVQWMRDDEFAWEPFGTATVVKVSAALDDAGRISDWTLDLFGHGHGNRPNARHQAGESSLLAARHIAKPLAPTISPRARSLTSGALRNATPLYVVPNMRVVDHHVAHQPIRTSALRSLGATTNVFAIESFMDELAEAAGQDPVAFRLAHLDDPRARAVIEKAALLAKWTGRSSARDATTGRGIGFAQYKNKAAYFACILEVRLDRDVRVTRAWAAVDAGMAVNPDGVINQAEGGIVQAASWTLKEQVTYDDTRITSLNWETYPSIVFSEVPEVEVALIDRPEEPPLGVGEAFAGPVAAAIGNAIYDATGVRLRDIPLTRARLIAALEETKTAPVTA